MPTFLLKTRKTLALEVVSVDAPTIEEAILQTVKSVAEGESIEVLDSEALPAGATGSTGATGTTGTTGASGPTGTMR
jgi:hypothetical protein